MESFTQIKADGNFEKQKDFERRKINSPGRSPSFK